MLESFPTIGLCTNFTISAFQELLDSTLQLMFSYFGNPDELIAEIKLRYPDLDNEDVELRTKALTRMETDYLFGSTSTFAAEHHSRCVLRILHGTIPDVSKEHCKCKKEAEVVTKIIFVCCQVVCGHIDLRVRFLLSAKLPRVR